MGIAVGWGVGTGDGCGVGTGDGWDEGIAVALAGLAGPFWLAERIGGDLH